MLRHYLTRFSNSTLRYGCQLQLRTFASKNPSQWRKTDHGTKKQPQISTPGRRYIEVDSPLAKANRYTYVKPDDPFYASEKVTRILSMGTVDDAADYVKALPIYLQSTVVWNQLLGHCARHGRANYAENYYVQMRKRGFEPNERTFTHMLTAYAKSNSPQAVEQAESWMGKMQDFNLQPSTIHINNLMRVYNNNQLATKTIETLKRISVDTMTIPDAVTYTIALQACSQLPQGIDSINYIWRDVMFRLEKKSREPTSLLAQKAQKIAVSSEPTVASSARDADLKIDNSLVIALLHATAQSAHRQVDIVVVLAALDRIYSLCPPEADQIMQKYHVDRKTGFGFPLSVKVLDAILRFSGRVKQYKLGQAYYQLALQQYPRLKPDKYCLSAIDWIDKQLKPRPSFRKRR